MDNSLVRACGRRCPLASTGAWAPVHFGGCAPKRCSPGGVTDRDCRAHGIMHLPRRTLRAGVSRSSGQRRKAGLRWGGAAAFTDSQRVRVRVRARAR
eukprot:8960845-Alexandrium_andersonii.AAC.1